MAVLPGSARSGVVSLRHRTASRSPMIPFSRLVRHHSAWCRVSEVGCRSGQAPQGGLRCVERTEGHLGCIHLPAPDNAVCRGRPGGGGQPTRDSRH
jgi:hypothetical protein